LSQFEYLGVFVSVVVAIAVAELLGGLGRLIRERDRVQVYWVHVAWMVLAILLSIQGWWVTWDLRSHEFTSVLELLVLVLPRLLFVLVAFILSPPIREGETLDLRMYYFRQVRWVAPLLAVQMIAFGAAFALFSVQPLASGPNAARMLAAGVFVYLAFSKNARLHEAAVVGLGCLLLLFMAVGPISG
jgi:hypothetical protein